VSDRIARTRQTYDEVAGRFLENTRDRSQMAPWYERFAKRLRAGDAVLDLGAGPGCDSAELRRLGLRAFSLDLSLGMLREGLREFPGPRVQADARRLPIRDGCLAGVWANASLLHLSPEEAAMALREARRVLGGRGLLHVAVKSGDGDEWETERYGSPRWFHYWSAADLDALLETSGFEVVESWSNSTPRADWLVRHAQPRAGTDPRTMIA
jgi:SAM-dependent methyltransferase